MFLREKITQIIHLRKAVLLRVLFFQWLRNEIEKKEENNHNYDMIMILMRIL